MNKQLLKALLDEMIGEGDATFDDVPDMLAVGAKVMIRTVTHYYTGKVVKITANFIELTDAAWVCDTGRWTNALSDGTLSEVEPMPHGVSVNRGALIDVSPWTHKLPDMQK